MAGVKNSLIGALPELTFSLGELQAIAKKEGIEFRVADYGGLRTQSDTTQIMQYRDADWNAAIKKDPGLKTRTTKEKWRPIAQWGTSMHNYGAAFDVLITAYPKGKSGLWALNWLADHAEQVGLVNGRSFGDPPHFEIPGGLETARRRWKEESGTSVFGFASPAALSSLAVIALAILFYFLVLR